jgi:hypothetical protein
MSAFLIDAPTGFIGVSGVWGAAIPNGAPAKLFPLQAENNYAPLWVQPFIVHTGADVSGAIGSAGIFPKTYLVAESDRDPLAAGFVQFNRQYAEIPSGFNDYATYTYTYPSLTTFRPEQKTETVVARVYNDFHLTSNPQSVTLSGAQQWRNVYGWQVTELGAGSLTNPNIATYSGWVGAGTEFVAEDATISRYIGPIWRRQTLYVKAK